MHKNQTPLRIGLTLAEAAAILNIAPRSLQRWGARGYGPQPIKDGSRVLYNPVDVASFAAGAVVA